jgi:hypothetical protein
MSYVLSSSSFDAFCFILFLFVLLSVVVFAIFLSSAVFLGVHFYSPCSDFVVVFAHAAVSGAEEFTTF